MKWAIPFFLGTIWCQQLVGQAAIVRERLNGDDDIVNQDITKDTDKGKTSECKDGETTMMECNHCFCAGGSWMCTKKGCGIMPVAEDTDKGKTPECQEGETKMAEDGCNTCGCAGGRWSCTEKACVPVSEDTNKGKTPECKEGETKMDEDGCNWCHCHGGYWGVCTERACFFGEGEVCKFTYQCRSGGSGGGCCHLGEDGIGRCKMEWTTPLLCAPWARYAKTDGGA